jgi:hypothetical protein
LVTGYEWRNELDAINRIGERMRAGLVELGRDAKTIEHSYRLLELLALSSEVSVKALELKDYQVKQ